MFHDISPQMQQVMRALEEQLGAINDRSAASTAMLRASSRCWHCRRRRARFSSLAAAAATQVCGFPWPRAQKGHAYNRRS